MKKWIKPVAGLLLAFIVVVAVLWLWRMRPRLTEEDIEQIAITTIQREVPAAFLVTGDLYLSSIITSANRKELLPDILGIDLGTTTTTLRVPGRVSYGFDIREINPEHIRVLDGGVIQIVVPQPVIRSIEPDLNRLQVRTDVGWARTHRRSGQETERRAMQHIQPAFRKQAESHLRTSEQPRINTAKALERMLAPALKAAGIPEPRFRFVLGSGLVLEPTG